MTALLSTLSTLVDRLDRTGVSATDVIQWASPVAAFGDLSNSLVATLGLNPSNREFVDQAGRELDGSDRRFHTLTSLGLKTWGEADVRHLRLMVRSFEGYFHCNPYDRWFRTLEHLVLAAGSSYYGHQKALACHLDLIPYATTRKWTDLTPRQRSLLLSLAGNALAVLLRDSPVRLLILNGQGVVDRFSDLVGSSLHRESRSGWSLPRSSSKDVMGLAYRGVVDELAGVDLGREIVVLGFNHNLQSSYGVTSSVIDSIRQWVGECAREGC